MRQVIVNTHSPLVVAAVPDDSLLVAEAAVQWSAAQRTTRLRFSPLPDTWRSRLDSALEPVARGKLQDYLNPLGRDADAETSSDSGAPCPSRICRCFCRLATAQRSAEMRSTLVTDGASAGTAGEAAPAAVHAHRLSDLIDDFSPLRRLPALQALEAELDEILAQLVRSGG
jgi:hypothetical protein